MKRVLLIEDLPQVAEHLKGMLGREKEIEVAGVQAQAEAGITQATTEKPDVVLVDALLQGKVTGFDVAKRIRAASPGTRIIMVTVPQRPVDPRPELGIDAVFVLPGGANELASALGGTKDAKREGGGQVIAVYSPKGGTGKSTIAVNLACVLRRNGASVALFDGVMQFGAVRHLLPVPPATRSIVDLPAGAAMRASLPEAIWEGPGGVAVLLAPPRPEEADLVAASELANAIGLLADGHDYVIVDTPSRLSEDTLAILDASSVILIVITYQGSTIANTRAAIDTFEALGYKGQKPILLVVNQADLTAGLSKGGMEHALNLPVIGEIPSDWKLVSESNNKQNPFVLSNANAPASQAIANLANALVSQQRKR
ncbi:MAG TPA: P-loop NTPase [Candidatus Limnocylindria bacterium]|nr:P-loop NTPase [Candidatus Limnocylindria bacterium]